MNQREEWRPVVGYEGHYEVSSDGRVRTMTTYHGRRPGEIYQHEYRNRPTGTLYRQVTLWSGAKGTTLKVHRLVLEAFVGRRPAGMVCCHDNGDGCDNRLANLRWDSPSANKQDSIRHGTVARGVRHPHAKLTETDVRYIRVSSESAYSIARRLGVSKQSVLAARNRETWAWLAN